MSIELRAGETQLLTVKQAAKHLAISERTLWSLTQRGDLASVRIGTRLVRYSLSALGAYIHRQQSR